MLIKFCGGDDWYCEAYQHGTPLRDKMDNDKCRFCGSKAFFVIGEIKDCKTYNKYPVLCHYCGTELDDTNIKAMRAHMFSHFKPAYQYRYSRRPKKPVPGIGRQMRLFL